MNIAQPHVPVKAIFDQTVAGPYAIHNHKTYYRGKLVCDFAGWLVAEHPDATPPYRVVMIAIPANGYHLIALPWKTWANYPYRLAKVINRHLPRVWLTTCRARRFALAVTAICGGAE